MSKENLKALFPQYPPISEAPQCPAGTDFYTWSLNEQRVIYSSIDKDGNVWGIQNPSAWKRIEKDGQTVIIRPKASLIMKAADFKKATGGSSFERKKKNDYGEF